MPVTSVRVRTRADDALAAALASLPARVGIDRDYPAAAVAEAEAAARSPLLPDRDATDIEFVTLDPPGSLDLDQALHLERDGTGWTVHYAIADVPSFIRPGGALDAETRRRGQTIYAPDGRIPLLPDPLGQDAASLLPDRVRGAYLWTFALDADGAVTDTRLERARVRSRRRLDYPTVQADLDAGRASGPVALLPEVGSARQRQELARGGASLPTPEVDVEPEGTGYRLVRRRPLPVEGWNAQLSLMTGIAAARIMLDGGVGILRTMPPAAPEDVERFRRRTAALGIPWTGDTAYGAYLAGLDLTDPRAVAIAHAAAALFRGAGYQAFDGAPPAQTEQAAIAAPYAHVTAPIRRLVDRFGLEVCLALSEGRRPAPDVIESLPALPALMAASGNVAGRLDRLAVDTVEAAVLSSRVGDVFEAVVVSAGDGRGVIQLEDPAVAAECRGELVAGSRIRARLETADIGGARVVFVAT